MEPYQPAWRRPIGEIFRSSARGPVRWCVRLGIHANWVSYSSMAAAAAGGLCFWQAQAAPALLILGVVVCYLRLWLNMLDGMVALAFGEASPAGSPRHQDRKS